MLPCAPRAAPDTRHPFFICVPPRADERMRAAFIISKPTDERVSMKTFGRKLIHTRFRWVILFVLSITFSASRLDVAALAEARLTGDWDLYVMVGAAPNGGFEARRRMGFAHFDGPSANGAWFKRRSGAPLYAITKVTVAGAQITVSLENGSEIVGLMKGNDFEGRIYRDA